MLARTEDDGETNVCYKKVSVRLEGSPQQAFFKRQLKNTRIRVPCDCSVAPWHDSRLVLLFIRSLLVQVSVRPVG